MEQCPPLHLGVEAIEKGAFGSPSTTHMKTNKTEYSRFKRGDIITLSAKPLKVVNKFTHLGSIISSTKTDVNIRLAKVWTAMDRLSVIWKFDFSDKIKRDFFPNCGCVSTTV